MYSGITLYVGDIPLGHLLYYVAFVFFTMALLGDGELRRIRPDGKLHYPWTRRHTEEAADDATGGDARRNLLERGQVPKGYGDYRQRN
jgi:hypothetical protein